MSFSARPGRVRWDRDPEYVRNRAIIRAQRRPCARCGRPIAYDQPYWLIGPTGRRKVNPWAFHCGHIVSRHRGGSHTLSNLQAEHAGCSIRDGARESNGHNGHKTPRVSVWPQLDTSKRW
jgi:hypothetical protein